MKQTYSSTVSSNQTDHISEYNSEKNETQASDLTILLNSKAFSDGRQGLKQRQAYVQRVAYQQGNRQAERLVKSLRSDSATKNSVIQRCGCGQMANNGSEVCKDCQKETLERFSDNNISALVQRDPPSQGANNTANHRQNSAQVSAITISCQDRLITFTTSTASNSYQLTSCDIPVGEYNATVQVRGNNINFDFGNAAEAGTRFDFNYRVEPGQINPARLFQGQNRVHISVLAENNQANVTDQTRQQPIEVPVTYTATLLGPADAGDAGLHNSNAPNTLSGQSSATSQNESSLGLPNLPGGHWSSGVGLGLHVFASGEHALLSGGRTNWANFNPRNLENFNWLARSQSARRVLTTDYWRTLIPRTDTITLDRYLHELPRDLGPRIEAELLEGRPLSWTRRGFSEEQLRSIPELVRRMNQGYNIERLTARELQLLEEAGSLHWGYRGGGSAGSPFASYTLPTNRELQLGNTYRYRVRVEMPRSATVDTVNQTPFNQHRPDLGLQNLDEMEFAVVANHEGRILHIQRGYNTRPTSGMVNSGAIRWGGRVFLAAGLGMSAYNIAHASPEEFPVVLGQEAGGQLGGWGGTALGTAGCIFLGIATEGLGLLACGLVGGFIGGSAGSAGGGWVAGEIASERPGSGANASSSTGHGGSNPCPNCHNSMRSHDIRPDFSRIRLNSENSNPEEDIRRIRQYLLNSSNNH